jgi:thiamine-monophosphate kinase
MRAEENPNRGHSRRQSSNDSHCRSEFDFIDYIRHRMDKIAEYSSPASAPYSSPLSRGIGDDAAVIRQLAGRDTVVTTDLLVEDIDFQRNATPAAELGHKALAISLSDIAAMGGRPRWSLLSIGIPQDIWDSNFVDDFYEGFFALAKRYDVALIGGDVSRTSDKIVIDSIVLGECRSEQAVFRSGAKPGDRLFVTGSLGGSAAGLRLIQRGARVDLQLADDEEWHLVKEVMLRHLRPEPRVGWGLILGQENLASAMIDVSDGLSSDLHHLCSESKVGAVIEAARLPVDPLVVKLSGRRALDPLILALNGGEDFELLFTVSVENASRLPKKVDGISLTCIGEINATGGIRVAEASRVWNLDPGGWEHFSQGRDLQPDREPRRPAGEANPGS